MGQARDEAGNIWETDAQGNPVRMLQAAGQATGSQGGGGVFSLPVSQQQAAQTANTQTTTAGNVISNQITAATAPSTISKAGSDATTAARQASTAGLPEGFMWSPDGQNAIPIPGYTRQGLSPEIRKGALDAFSDADAIDKVVTDLRAQYNKGPGATSGVAGLRDFLPTEQNKIFNDTGQRARGYVKRALGFTGGEGNTVAESSSLYDPYLPSAGDRDEQILAKITALQGLANQARAKAQQTLGGVPNANGGITPLNGMVYGAGADTQAAAAGSTTKLSDLPPGYQEAVNAYIGSGRFNPAGYAQLRAALDRSMIPGSADRSAEYETFARDNIAPVLQQGGSIKDIPGVEERMSGREQLRNNLVNNPVGAALVGATDAASFGGVSALDRMTGGSRVEDLRNASTGNMIGMLGGEIGGAIGGTAALGRLGRETVGRALPGTLGGAETGQLARDLGVDALYSGVYGYNQGRDPLESVAFGAGGSLAGRATGRAIGGAVGGVAQSPAVAFLRQQGIPLTTGQTVGGILKRFEDALMSAPVIGDQIGARRLEGLQAFNRAAFNEAGAPIGANVPEIGEMGIRSLRQQMGGAYDRATAGVDVPFDQQFATDIAALGGTSARLPPDYAAAFNTIGERRIQPLIDRGSMTGADYQQATRGLRAARRNAGTVGSTGFEQEYRDALTGAINALEGNMRRGGGASVVEGLDNADAVRRNLGTLETATRNAAGGSQSGDIFTFTPSQLQRAGITTESRFPGPRPFARLTDEGQRVLPSTIPDSGTARRLTALALPATLGGTGAGIGAYSDGVEGAKDMGLGGIALGTALALGGTRQGQRVIDTIIAERPELFRDFGQALANRRGMFGRAAIPLALPIAAGQ